VVWNLNFGIVPLATTLCVPAANPRNSTPKP
jgi:hypothetical protein